MIKICSNRDINFVDKMQKEVILVIKKSIKILNENYGENRDVDKDLGGYILLVENLEDTKEIKEGVLKELLPEYTDEIICSEGVNYTS